MNPIDTNKVSLFLVDLNRLEATGTWVEIQGVSSLMSVNIAENGSVAFQANQGYLVKGFLNTRTGEVKMYSASIFTKK